MIAIPSNSAILRKAQRCFLRIAGFLHELSSRINTSRAKTRELIGRYRIPDTSYLSPPKEFSTPRSWRNFQADLEEMKDLLTGLVEKNQAASFYKFGDGDYYFLEGLPVGSAMPGRRAISRALTESELAEYNRRALQADYYMCELLKINRLMFASCLKGKQIDYPAEFAYGLLASGWLTRRFRGKVGLIGSEKKLKIIRSLIEVGEYQDYLGLDRFEDYIPIPDKFAADNLPLKLEKLQEALQESKSSIFILGVGHLKSGILSRLGDFKKAVYFDVGSGIDALAGIIDTRRPYMGSWINHQLPDRHLYSEVDLLNFNNGNIRLLG